MANGRKTGGRQKGTPNTKTREAKEAIAAAFEGIGGVKALTKWARENPGPFYASIYPKLLPVQHKDGGDPGSATPIAYHFNTVYEPPRQ